MAWDSDQCAAVLLVRVCVDVRPLAVVHHAAVLPRGLYTVLEYRNNLERYRSGGLEIARRDST